MSEIPQITQQTSINCIDVIHVIDALSPGGAERVLVELVKGLQRRSVRVGVCVTRRDTTLADRELEGVPLEVLRRRSTWDIDAIVRFARYCRDHKVRLLHAHGRGSIRFCGAVKAYSRGTIKVVAHDHFGDIVHNQGTSFTLRLSMALLADHYIAVDPELGFWAGKVLRISAKKISVLGNAFDFRRFHNARPLDRSSFGAIEQPFLGAVVANLRPQKDHPLLFRAMASSPLVKQNLHVLLVGLDCADEYSRYCRRIVVDLGLERNVTFVGVRNDIPDILHTVDFGLLSSRSESGPIALIEYMISGLPFLVTAVGEITHSIQKFGIGLIVEPGNDLQFRHGLEKLLSLSSIQHHAIGGIERQIVHNSFDIDDKITQLLKIYNELNPTLNRQSIA